MFFFWGERCAIVVYCKVFSQPDWAGRHQHESRSNRFPFSIHQMYCRFSFCLSLSFFFSFCPMSGFYSCAPRSGLSTIRPVVAFPVQTGQWICIMSICLGWDRRSEWICIMSICLGWSKGSGWICIMWICLGWDRRSEWICIMSICLGWDRRSEGR